MILRIDCITSRGIHHRRYSINIHCCQKVSDDPFFNVFWHALARTHTHTCMHMHAQHSSYMIGLFDWKMRSFCGCSTKKLLLLFTEKGKQKKNPNVRLEKSHFVLCNSFSPKSTRVLQLSMGFMIIFYALIQLSNVHSNMQTNASK